MTFIAIMMTCVVLAVTVLSSLSDIRSLRIPNVYSVIVIAAFAVAFAAAPGFFHPLDRHLIAMAVVFAVTYIMFLANVIGGGDAKFATSLALWLGLKSLLPFMFYMACAGGILGLAALLIQKKKFFKNPSPGSWVEQAQSGRSAIPYGLAIGFAFWIELLHAGFIRRQLDAFFQLMS